MGWRPEEKKIELLREQIGEAPEEVKDRIIQAIGETSSPSYQVRLYGLLVAAYRTLGEYGKGERIWAVAEGLGGSDVARAELAIQVAILRNAMNAPGSACRLAEKAQDLLKRPLLRQAGKSSASLRRSRWVRTLYSWTFFVLGEACLDTGRPHEALQHGISLLKCVSPRFAVPRTLLSAFSVIAVAIVRGAGTAQDIENVLRQCQWAARLVKAGRKSVPAIKLQWIRGLCLARLGATGLAEALLLGVIADLRTLKSADAELAAVDLLWIVAERGGQHSRALYLCQTLSLPQEAVPRDSFRTFEKESPIGF